MVYITWKLGLMVCTSITMGKLQLGLFFFFPRGDSHCNRWHADIKPDNILSVQGKFKLADPGFAKFVKKIKKTHKVLPRQHVLGGTETYGKKLSISRAPERALCI
jgi:hypothetical protein